MIEDLKNKAVLITGASTGIGAAAAIAFGQNGAKVAVHYNKSKAEAEKVAAQVEKAGYYPTTYRIVYDATAREYRIALGSLVKRQ